MTLHLPLVTLPIIEGAKRWRQSAQCSDQPKLTDSDVDDEPELRLLRKCESGFGFVLHISERISCRRKVRGQAWVAVARKRKVAGLICDLEAPTQQLRARLDVSCPRHDLIREAHIGPSLKALQPACFDQLIAELAEARCDLVL